MIRALVDAVCTALAEAYDRWLMRMHAPDTARYAHDLQERRQSQCPACRAPWPCYTWQTAVERVEARDHRPPDGP